jgi:hypothetical protein
VRDVVKQREINRISQSQIRVNSDGGFNLHRILRSYDSN